jgi:type IV pilus assembly protein PilB
MEFDDLWRPVQQAEAPRGPAAVLLDEGKITPAQFQAALRKQKENSRLTMLEALVESKVVDEATALQAVAKFFNLRFEPVKADQIDRDVLKLLDLDFIKRKNVIPIRREENKIVVGISDPADIFLVDEVKRRLRRPLQLVVTPAADIQRVAEELTVTPSQGSVEDIIQDCHEDDVEFVEAKSEEVTDLEKIAGESPVIRYVNFLVVNAVKEGASDIHIEPGEEMLRIRYRIDGILFEQQAPPLAMHAAVVSRLKIMANLDIAERRLPQDGRIRAMVHGRHVDLRLSTLPTTHGEKCVIRILDNRSILIGLERLGMLPDTLKSFVDNINQPHGILLVTGPTGSGKTTTLYSALRVMDGGKLNISTVEDPVEYELDFANQVNVREGIGLTFSAALRSLLRQDPDVIMVGEVRDAETARIAVQASLTGHMVLSTLHTNDAPASITRLINIGIEPYLIAASVNAVLAQRLVRKICDKCKRIDNNPREADVEYLKRRNAQVSAIYRGAGCEKCRNTGYSGRVGLYELLEMNDDLRDVITSNPSLLDLRRACHERGMRLLQEDGLMKVQAGQTTIEEIARVTEV